MRFLLRVLVVFVLVMAALSALRGMFSQSRLNRSGSKGPTGDIRTGKLIRDPVCGTYVTDEQSISTSRNSEVFYFCSEECREKFLATGT